MNNKGFVFVETIVVTVVLTVALIFIYSTFSGVLSSEKKRLAYEDTGYMYNTFYLQKFISTLNINNYINHYFKESSDTVIKQFSCNDVLLYKGNDEINTKGVFCENLINKTSVLGIKNVYITKYNVNELKNCIYNKCNNTNIKKNIENLNVSFINYLKTLKPNNELDDYYRIIVEYEESEYDYDNYMNKKTTEPFCQTDYTLINNLCIKKIKKYYYDNIIIKAE